MRGVVGAGGPSVLPEQVIHPAGRGLPDSAERRQCGAPHSGSTHDTTCIDDLCHTPIIAGLQPAEPVPACSIAAQVLYLTPAVELIGQVAEAALFATNTVGAGSGPPYSLTMQTVGHSV